MNKKAATARQKLIIIKLEKKRKPSVFLHVTM